MTKQEAIKNHRRMWRWIAELSERSLLMPSFGNYKGGASFDNVKKKQQSQPTVFQQQAAAEKEKRYQQAKNVSGISREAYNKIQSSKKSKSAQSAGRRTTSSTSSASSKAGSKSGGSKPKGGSAAAAAASSKAGSKSGGSKPKGGSAAAVKSNSKSYVWNSANKNSNKNVFVPVPLQHISNRLERVTGSGIDSPTVFQQQAADIKEKRYQQAKNVSGISRAAFEAAERRKKEAAKAAAVKPSAGKWLWNNAAAGAAQFNKSLVGALDLLSPAPFDTNIKTGERNTFGKWMDSVKNKQDNIIRIAEQTNAKRGKVGQYGGALAQGTVIAIPSLFSAAASAGASVAGGLAESVSGAAVSLSDDVAGAAMRAVKSLVTEAAKKPSFWLSYAQTAGNSYNEAKAEGESEDVATIYALINGAVSSGVEISGGLEAMPSGRQLKSLIKNAIEEGNEEVIQNLISRATKRVTYRTKPEFNPKELPGELARDWALGAGTGAILGTARYGVSAGADAAKAAGDTYKVGKAINAAGAAADVVEAGQQSGENRAAKKYADKLAPKLKVDEDGNATGLSNWQAGRQHMKNLEAIAEDAALARAVRDSSGAEVAVRSDMPSWDNGSVNVKTRDISVSDKADTAFADTVKHETTHLAERYAPEQYKDYEKNIINAALQNDAAAVEQRRQRLLELGYSSAEVDSELAAELAAPLLNNRAAIERLARSKPSFSEKMADVVASAAAHLKNLSGKKYVTDNGITLTYPQMQRAEFLWRDAVRKSGAVEGDGGGESFVTDDGMRFSKTLSFSEQVDATFSGGLKPTDAVYIRDTSAILGDVGLDISLPMLITQKHLRKINSSGPIGHNLPVDTIKALPDFIENPVMIFDSPSPNSGICVIANATDANMDPILISIKPNGFGTYNDVSINSNFVTSMYGKERFNNYIKRVIKNDDLLYINKEKSQQLFGKIGLQLPQLPNNVDFDIIIHQSRNIVKSFEKKFKKI